jgi:hypothetical protein
MNSSVSNLLYPEVQIPEIDKIIDEFLDDSEIEGLDSDRFLYSYKRILRSDGHYDFIKNKKLYPIQIPRGYTYNVSITHNIIWGIPWDHKYLCVDKGFAYSIENGQLVQINILNLESREIMNGLPILSSNDYDDSGNKLRVIDYVIYLIVDNLLYIKDDENVILYEFETTDLLSFPQGKCINNSRTMLILKIEKLNDKSIIFAELNLIGNIMSIVPDESRYI